MPIPWVEKYRPKSFSEIVNQEEAKQILASWICTRFKAPQEFCARWAKRRDKEIKEARAVLLWGPPGIGKTTLVHALAKEIGYELVELNASDVRTGERIRQVVGRGLREASLFGYAGKIVLFDEVDGLHEFGIPFYVLAPTSTIDTKSKVEEVKIEERDPDEVRTVRTSQGPVYVTVKDVPVFNPVFDVTPPKYVTGIITEKGVAIQPLHKNLRRLLNLT